jgi:Mg/Co/Ni transporter MgtE
MNGMTNRYLIAAMLAAVLAAPGTVAADESQAIDRAGVLQRLHEEARADLNRYINGDEAGEASIDTGTDPRDEIAAEARAALERMRNESRAELEYELRQNLPGGQGHADTVSTAGDATSRPES